LPQVVRTPNSTFVKGLITEASLLNFPEGASVDEVNCDLRRTGVRETRKGINFDSTGDLSTWTLDEGLPTAEFTWENVSGESGVEFLVLQTGDTLRFYDKSFSPVSDGEKSFTVDLNVYTASNSYLVDRERISASTVGSYFVVTSRAIESIILSYDVDTDTISVREMMPRIRDFDWQGDISTYFDTVSAASVTAARRYDTFNTGWVSYTGPVSSDGVLNTFQSDNAGAWPQLSSPWHAGKDPTNDDRFRTNQFERIGKGNTLIANGHFILKLYNKQRAAAYNDEPLNTETPITTVELPDEVEVHRFSAVTSYAGRAWLAGINSAENGSKVFFTKVITSLEDFDKFYNVNDPTSEDISDPLDNDGGVINIPQAGRITALFEWGNSLIVMAENGPWEIKGVDNVFKATEYAVSRVRQADGLIHPGTLVDAEGVPFWWGPTGIFTIEGDNVTTAPTGTDLSKATVQTFWEDIGAEFRAKAKGVYDALNKRIFWLYGDDAANPYKYNKVLILDLVLQAFIPWSITDEENTTSYIVGGQYFTGLGSTENSLDVVVGADLVEAGGVQVVVTLDVDAANAAGVTFVLRDGNTGKIGFGKFDDTTYLDWGTEDYDAYAEAAYVFDGDLSTRKKNIIVTVAFERTEDGFTGAGSGYTPTNQSKCTLKAYWEDNENPSSNKEIYKLKRLVLVDTGDLTAFNYPYSRVITRNRIRGRGRYLKLRFQNTPGKQFKLIGYEVINAKNSGV